MPERCPACATPVVREEGEVALRCPNRECPAVRRQRLFHFVSRAGMDIDGLGKRLVEQLLSEGLVGDPASLWDLDRERLAALPHWGEKSAENVIDEIAAARTRPLWRLLVGAGDPPRRREGRQGAGVAVRLPGGDRAGRRRANSSRWKGSAR